MSCPYDVRIHDKPRPSQPGPDLLRPIPERHGDARHVPHVGEDARVRDADALQEATGGVCGKRKHNSVRLVRRATGACYPPAVAGARQAGNTLADPERPGEPLAERRDQLTHPRGEAPESCRHLRTPRLDAEYRGGTSFLDRGELLPCPQGSPAGTLIHHLIPDPQLQRERGQLGLARKKAVRPALDDKSLHVLGHDHAARPALALVDSDLTVVGPRELPRRREARHPCADDGDPHSQPRSVAAVRTTSATAATSPASLLSDAVRSSCKPSRRANA